jgi:hypothetical protein
MDLPLLLAGPILRRVEPALVSVWLAFSVPVSVRLQVWEGRAETGRPDPFLESPPTSSLRVAARLHVVEVTIVIPATDGKSLQADALYSYDVQVSEAAGPVQTLATMGLLEVVEPRDEAGQPQLARVPLGYEPGLLPGFAPPPSDLASLSLLYGSCRRAGHPDPDALAMVDDLIFRGDAYQDPRARPHQLFLGGDQIYADDVTPLHMLLVMELAIGLIGWTGAADPPSLREPVEHIRLDTVLKKIDETSVVDPANPAAAYEPEDPVVTATDPDLPVDRAHFPDGQRLSTTRRDAQFTSEDGSSHVISLGEFAALYLTVWSNAVWGTEVTGAAYAADAAQPGDHRAIAWDEQLPDDGLIVMPDVMYPDRVAGHLYLAPGAQSRAEKKTWADVTPEKVQRSLRESFRILQEFRRTLPKVQRALANVPTYMMLDDHDVTDDYFLNPMWRDRVLTSELGQAILHNAMVAYALFQDWGNDPLAYQAGARQELLSLVPRLFPEGATAGPDLSVVRQVAHLLGHDLRNTPTADGRYDSVTPPIRWHFQIDGPRHRVIAFDNRTRRSYGSRNGPPGNVSIDAQVDQIPLPPLPGEREVLLVIAPLQVIGPPVLDELVAPLSYRAFDAIAASHSDSDTSPSSTTGLREMLGTNPDAIEAWAFDTVTFEHLLQRLAPYRRVVLLSGDVHNSSGSLMSYWPGAAAQPARFAQFTSSGFKNVMPAFITATDRAAGFAQQLVRANLGTERIAWHQPLDDLVLLPDGTSQLDLVPVMRSRLQSVPVMVPSWGWPDHNDPADPAHFDPGKASRLNPARPPDWRWRVTALRDARPEAQRPAAVRLLAVDEAAIDQNLASPSTVLEAYQAIAARHQHALNRMRNARQILFRANVGRVSFHTYDDGRLDAIHEVYTAFADPDQPAAVKPAPEVFLRLVAPLGPEDETPPTRLRQSVLEVPRAATGGG